MALEIRQNMADDIKMRFPAVKVYIGDCQARLDIEDGYFDRILAIYVLEHLPNLPAAIEEMHRLSNRTSGVFSVVIPCEGGAAYSFARRISGQRIFEKLYKQSYQWLIEREHLNKPNEILAELTKVFTVTHKAFFPLPLPLILCNLCIGLTLGTKPL